MSLKKESRTDVQFHLAALRGDVERLKQLLDTGKVHIDSRDRDGTTPLILSAAMGHTECVRELLAQGADPACCRTTGTTALFFAAQGGCVSAARELLDAGARVDAPSVDGGTPLFVACQCGHLPVVEELIRRGANVNSCMKPRSEPGGQPYISSPPTFLKHTRVQDGATPLFIGAQNGHAAVLAALLAAGAEPAARRGDGATPLWIAAQLGHAAAARALLHAGADADALRQDGASPLFKAAHKGHAAVVVELLRHRANRGLLPNGQTALHGAAMFGHVSCARLLLGGCDVTAALRTRNAAGLTPAQAAAAHGRADVLKYFESLTREHS